jgi:hypothetical protein
VPAVPKNTATTADECTVATDKLFALLEHKGRPLPADKRGDLIEECRKQPGDPMIRCVAAAADDDAVERCFTAPKGEPLDQLTMATNNLRTYFFVHETFANMKAPLTPATPCCRFPTKKCPAESSPDETLTQILELDLSKERDFQYRVEATDRKAVIEAVGDRDCDGVTITYRRELEMRDDGNMHITVLDPPANSD